MLFLKKRDLKRKIRFVDGPFLSVVKKSKKKNWYWLLVIPLIFSFVFIGKLSASYVLPKLNLLSLFRDGKYLVLFQNNAELRSSGGFIGSYAVVEVRNFEVKNISFNTNIYALDNEFARSNYIAPPKGPLKNMLNEKTLALRDANYDASFTDAASDIIYFYEQETQDKIDGVIGLNATVIVDLLKITGPITVPETNTLITADNFYFETQSQVERFYFQNPENWVLNEPKKFLKELYPAILANALKDKIALFNLIKEELTQKEIVIYFKDLAKQQLVEKNNLAGAIPDTKQMEEMFSVQNNVDYLYINSNSYSGNKSSVSLKEDVVYKLDTWEKNNQKMYLVNLKISRAHSGSYEWPDGKNLEWLRVYAPHTAQFLSASLNKKDISREIEVGSESGKTFFGREFTTEPGQANIIEISYLIPYEKDYHLLVQKQPGRTDNIAVNLDGQLLFDGLLDRDLKLSLR